MKSVLFAAPGMLGVPFLFTGSEILARAALRFVEGRAERCVLESADINRLGA